MRSMLAGMHKSCSRSRRPGPTRRAGIQKTLAISRGVSRATSEDRWRGVNTVRMTLSHEIRIRAAPRTAAAA